MEIKDYYKILGVPRTATPKEIKAAFRKAARKHHPDFNKGDAKAEATFKEVNEAPEVPPAPDKRKRYDALGPDFANFRPPPPGAGGAAGPGGVYVDFGGEDAGGFSEFFRTIFGGGFGGGGRSARGGGFEDIWEREAEQAPGHDLQAPVELTLDEVQRGTTRAVQVGEDGNSRTVEVRIPPGVRENSRVRAVGEGGAGGKRGKRGDLYLRVKVRPHPQFERKGDDLQASVSVPLTTAVLGGEVEVPTLEGPIGIKVPPGSRPGRTFRLRGHGLPRLESPKEKGDLLAVLGV